MPRNPNKIDYSGGLPAGFESFQVIEDPRTGGNKRHYFGEVLFMAVSATLCGMNNFAEVEAFCEEQTDWLKKWIRLPNGVPRAQTFYNIFALIEPGRFNHCLVEHLNSISPGLREQVIALDGKSLRGSHTLKQGPVHTVSAWASQQRVTLCQEHLSESENEIGAIKRLLDQLDIEGQTVTIDAIGTQREIAGKIIAKKGHYLLALKGNQPALHKQAIDQFDFGLRHLNLREAKGWSIHQDREKKHGRDTLCSIVATDRLDWMESEIREIWPGLRSLVIIENQTTTLPSKREHRRQRRYYISSLPADAVQLRESIRAHWGIENNCHWTLDTCFGEDANKTGAGNAAKNLATVRRIVLNILSNDTGVIKSMPQKRLRALMNQSYRERLLSLA